MMRKCLLLLILLALTSPVRAQQGPATTEKTGALMTGRALSLLCSSDKPDDIFSCQSYIAGIIDYHRLLKGLGNAPSVDFCPPANTPMEQIRGVVIAYIGRHTEHQDFIAAPGVAMSLFAAYPCKRR